VDRLSYIQSEIRSLIHNERIVGCFFRDLLSLAKMTIFVLIIVCGSAILHAGWNLIAHSQRTNSTLFLQISLIIGLGGLIPVIFAEIYSTPFPAKVWILLVLTGIFQTFYYLGLTMGYRNGDFSFVYPVARALPVLLLAFWDLGRGHVPSPIGWLGIMLIIFGCILSPLKSTREIAKIAYWNRATPWIICTVIATLGYTTIDKLAAEALPIGAETAARYGVWQALFTIPPLWIALKLMGEPIPKIGSTTPWKSAVLSALFIFSSYWLMLWAYQLSPFTSYLFGLRQLSIVIGVVMAIAIFQEPAPKLRISAALIITVGIICLSLT
jgi:drug/metabolite transporter (DMT)-like permease